MVVCTNSTRKELFIMKTKLQKQIKVALRRNETPSHPLSLEPEQIAWLICEQEVWSMLR